MHTIDDQTELENSKATAALVLFGGQQCGVCQTLKPRIEAMLAAEFPGLTGHYVDCHGSGALICAQEGVFSLPLVQVWFEGQKFAQFGRVFSLGQLREAIARPYHLAFGTAPATDPGSRSDEH